MLIAENITQLLIYELMTQKTFVVVALMSVTCAIFITFRNTVFCTNSRKEDHHHLYIARELSDKCSRYVKMSGGLEDDVCV